MIIFPPVLCVFDVDEFRGHGFSALKAGAVDRVLDFVQGNNPVIALRANINVPFIHVF
jgi:hypothetical protein